MAGSDGRSQDHVGAPPLARSPLHVLRDSARTWVRKTAVKAHQSAEGMYNAALTSPRMLLAVCVIIAAVLGNVGLSFQDQIDDDVEIFLPDDAESTDLLLEVREEWSTDLAIIYVQTSNAVLGGGRGENISDEAVLREMSWVEGDADNADGGPRSRGIDWSKTDHGRDDGILWILSPAQVIKEANSADGRFNRSACVHGVNTRIPLNFECDMIPGGGEYVIPDQNRVDALIENLGGAFTSMVRDTNDNDLTVDSDGDGDPTNDADGDGVWDTAAIVIGLNHDLEQTEFADFEALLAHVQDVIDERPDGLRATDMTVTGLTKVLADISDAIYQDLLTMLPWSLAFTVGVITLLHRSAKVVIITGTPIVLALAVTFGGTVLLNLTLTPMIVATFPILIGLGVDYALHMVNRIEERRRHHVDEAHNANRRRQRMGEAEQPVPDLWDLNLYRTCIMEMTKTTGTAVLLSAVTTVIGFSVLMAPAIVPVTPIRSVGVTLVLGIASTLVFSLLLVPTLAWMLKYNRRATAGAWSPVSKAPVQHWYAVVGVVLVVTSIGVANIDALAEPITGSSEAPDGIDSLEKLATYSQQFDSGQTSLFVFDASQRPNDNGTDNIRDLPVLDEIDRIEHLVTQVEATNTTSIVLFLRSIPVTIELAGGVTLYEGSLWDLLHDECWESNDPIACGPWLLLEASGEGGRESLRRDMVNVVFDTLTEEVRSMLLNEDGTKAIVYVDQPYMNLNVAAGLRDEIDAILDDEPLLPSTRASHLTGGLPVSLDINEGIHDTQTRTTIITMVVLTVFLVAIFRSLRIGLYTMVPVAVVILWQPLMMRSGDVNVNIFTAMIGTIVFGIGVDDAIHMMHRIREEGETPTGLADAVESTGQTIFETSATTIAGIAAGFLVAFPGLVNFFTIMALLIAAAFLTSCFLLPALLAGELDLRSMIKHRTRAVDFSGGVTSSERMQTLDAVLE
jgi:predicted RND superfamily exporter protein